MSENDKLAPLSPRIPIEPVQPRSLMSTVDLEAADSFAYLRTNWDILVKHRALILLVTILSTVLVTIYCFQAQPIYQATARIEVEADAPLIQSLNDLFRAGEPSDDTFLQTQVNILQS